MTLAAALSLALCPMPPAVRVNCVVDADTFWLAGEKIRLADIDGAEIEGKCAAERALAIRGRDRLLDLLNSGPVKLQRTGVDRYGRTLGRVYAGGRDVGAVLVKEDLARPYAGGRKPWCPAPAPAAR